MKTQMNIIQTVSLTLALTLISSANARTIEWKNEDGSKKIVSDSKKGPAFQGFQIGTSLDQQQSYSWSNLDFSEIRLLSKNFPLRSPKEKSTERRTPRSGAERDLTRGLVPVGVVAGTGAVSKVVPMLMKNTEFFRSTEENEVYAPFTHAVKNNDRKNPYLVQQFVTMNFSNENLGSAAESALKLVQQKLKNDNLSADGQTIVLRGFIDGKNTTIEIAFSKILKGNDKGKIAVQLNDSQVAAIDSESLNAQTVLESVLPSERKIVDASNWTASVRSIERNKEVVVQQTLYQELFGQRRYVFIPTGKTKANEAMIVRSYDAPLSLGGVRGDKIQLDLVGVYDTRVKALPKFKVVASESARGKIGSITQDVVDAELPTFLLVHQNAIRSLVNQLDLLNDEAVLNQVMATLDGLLDWESMTDKDMTEAQAKEAFKNDLRLLSSMVQPGVTQQQKDALFVALTDSSRIRANRMQTAANQVITSDEVGQVVGKDALNTVYPKDRDGKTVPQPHALTYRKNSQNQWKVRFQF